MRKVLLIGNLTDVLQGINEKLSKEYTVQICAFQKDNIQGMMKIVRPDMLVVCVVDMNPEDMEVFDWLAQNKESLPVLLVSSKDKLINLGSWGDWKKIKILYPPFGNDDLIKRCKELLYEKEYNEKAAMKVKAKRVLIIDDSAVVLRSIKLMLENQYEVLLATDGKFGFQKAVAKKPDIILLDYEMPVIDGNQTFELLLQAEETKDIPVVFLTGVSDPKKVREVLEKNPAGYILKPVDRDKLIIQINEILDKRG